MAKMAVITVMYLAQTTSNQMVKSKETQKFHINSDLCRQNRLSAMPFPLLLPGAMNLLQQNTNDSNR